ncbi:MAG: hypothetical protein ACIAS6_03425 [Phycisphaerales bacterium JB060]
MHRCLLNPALERVRVNGFAFPLGVYPVEPIAPASGYTADFEPADGDEEWEEWPDRYVYEILVSAERLKPLCSALLSLLPGRVYPILDVLGNDAFREIDPYIAYELVGVESLYDGVRWYEPFLFEDGLCGFGAMSEEPFMYFFLDEHKVLTVRVETSQKERVDRLLAAFELANLGGSADNGAGGRARRPDGRPQIEVMAADAVSHEHRSVLLTPEDRPELPGPEEVAEALVDLWGMTLNIDVERNLDDDGRELGVTGWRCLVRVDPPMSGGADDAGGGQEGSGERETPPGEQDRPEPEKDQGPRVRYAEVLLAAGCWREAEDLAVRAVEKLPDETASKGVGAPVAEGFGPRVVSADRLWRRELAAFLAVPLGKPGAHASQPPAPPEAHLARSSDPSPLVTPPPESQPSSGSMPPTDPDVFDDPSPAEPPEIARQLDEALANDAAGRILASRWLE